MAEILTNENTIARDVIVLTVRRKEKNLFLHRAKDHSGSGGKPEKGNYRSGVARSTDYQSISTPLPDNKTNFPSICPFF